MKTYSLTSTEALCGSRSNWGGAAWNLYGKYTNSDELKIGRRASAEYYATYYKFDEATLALLRTKNVLSIRLSLTVVSGKLPASTNTNYQIGYKYTADTGTAATGSAWARCDAEYTQIYRTTIGYVRNTGSMIDADNTLVEINLDGSDVPKYGYALGAGTDNITRHLILAPTAVLTVVTDESATYTVSYDANTGSGAPASQQKTEGEPLTLSSVEPTKTGYLFTKWNTAADGSGVDYLPGATYILDENVTLYAQWSQITQTGVYVKGSDNTMHQGTVWVKGSDNTMHEATLYVKGSDNNMHQSS